MTPQQANTTPEAKQAHKTMRSDSFQDQCYAKTKALRKEEHDLHLSNLRLKQEIEARRSPTRETNKIIAIGNFRKEISQSNNVRKFA